MVYKNKLFYKLFINSSVCTHRRLIADPSALTLATAPNSLCTGSCRPKLVVACSVFPIITDDTSCMSPPRAAPKPAPHDLDGRGKGIR